jgi:hypothetical protein
MGPGDMQRATTSPPEGGRTRQGSRSEVISTGIFHDHATPVSHTGPTHVSPTALVGCCPNPEASRGVCVPEP